MKVVQSDGNVHLLALSSAEIALLGNSLNEVCHGIDVAEFSTRLGATREEAETLFREISRVGVRT